MLATGEGEHHGGMSAAQKYDNNDFGGQGSDFQRAINAHVVENI
jgi:erythrocyte band 7 integral membrane protein